LSVDIAELRRLFSYDPVTGTLTRLLTTNSRARAGTPITCTNGPGYVVVNVNYKKYTAHRIAWAITHGYWPECVDHINGVKSDNRLINLREVTHAQNMHNLRAARIDSASGLLGVSWAPASGKWRANICIDRKTRHIGYYDTKEEAFAAYLKAKAVVHSHQTLIAEQGIEEYKVNVL